MERDETIDWQWYELLSARLVRIYYSYAGPPVKPLSRVVVEERAGSVRIELRLPQTGGKMAVVSAAVDIELRGSVGDRALIDASKNRLAQHVSSERAKSGPGRKATGSGRHGGNLEQVIPEFI